MTDDLRWMSPLLRHAWCYRAEDTPPAAGDGDQASTTGTGQAPDAQAAPQAGAATMTLAEAQAALSAARRDAAANRTKLTALEKAQADTEAAKLSELDKAKKEAADLKAALAQRDHADLQREVAAASALPAAMATRLQGATREDLLADAKALAALMPAADTTPSTATMSTAAAMNPAVGRGGAQLTIADVRKMTPAQVTARWPEVKKVLATQQ